MAAMSAISWLRPLSVSAHRHRRLATDDDTGGAPHRTLTGQNLTAYGHEHLSHLARLSLNVESRAPMG